MLLTSGKIRNYNLENLYKKEIDERKIYQPLTIVKNSRQEL